MAKQIGNMQEVIVLIPSLNEKHNLEVLLPDIPKIVCNKKISVLIIDDGSTDKTNKLILPENVRLISNKTNEGQGSALKHGYLAALSAGAEFIVTMDADGQNKPEELKNLLQPIIDDKADFVIGSRIIGKFEKDSLFRLCGVVIYSGILSLLLRIKITDCSSGYRAIKATVLQSIVNNLSQPQYHSAELLMETAFAGFRIKEVPVTIKKRISGKSKKGNDILYGFYFARTILNTWLRKILSPVRGYSNAK